MTLVAERRHDQRFLEPPIIIEIDGQAMPVEDLSLSGLRLSGAVKNHRQGDLVTCTVRLPSLIGHRSVSTPAKIVVSNGAWVACTFVRPDQGFLMCLKHCLDSLEDKIPTP